MGNITKVCNRTHDGIIDSFFNNIPLSDHSPTELANAIHDIKRLKESIFDFEIFRSKIYKKLLENDDCKLVSQKFFYKARDQFESEDKYLEFMLSLLLLCKVEDVIDKVNIISKKNTIEFQRNFKYIIDDFGDRGLYQVDSCCKGKDTDECEILVEKAFFHNIIDIYVYLVTEHARVNLSELSDNIYDFETSQVKIFEEKHRLAFVAELMKKAGVDEKSKQVNITSFFNSNPKLWNNKLVREGVYELYILERNKIDAAIRSEREEKLKKENEEREENLKKEREARVKEQSEREERKENDALNQPIDNNAVLQT